MYLADFFRLGGTPPPPTLLAENHFAKKTLAEMGGTPPLTNSPLSFSGKKFLKMYEKR